MIKSLYKLSPYLFERTIALILFLLASTVAFSYFQISEPLSFDNWLTILLLAFASGYFFRKVGQERGVKRLISNFIDCLAVFIQIEAVLGKRGLA